ncbi:MAG: ribonuclease III [Deltaproteobacteria bacterium]|nr:ribonuclease III [Deltaproteobacteria bacterium]MBW2049638.1 ribonuclease III [Deltaproteobacteria bacterium]MBW2111998.1 ribonuclease III [Deltaproteobacteria bacterium]MBW2354332.1 ribonuclease III [Deltaproteobacteria bacterium]
MNTFETLEKNLGYSFRNAELLAQALCHSSYVNEHAHQGLKDNERLEFLGDAVLDLVISHILMFRFKEVTEGELSKFRALVVDEAGLYRVGVGLGLGDYLLLGKGEEQSGGREKPSILADATEALIGAIYLDAGFNKAMEVIEKLFAPLLERVGTGDLIHDFKSLLQEFTQQSCKVLPRYRLIKEAGPAHDRNFQVELTLKGEILARGEGKSKKEAEQHAARRALFTLKEGRV